MRAKSLRSYLILCNPMDCSLQGSPVHGDSTGKNTEMGCHALLQGTSLTQGLNLCLPALSDGYFTHLGSPHCYLWDQLFY